MPESLTEPKPLPLTDALAIDRTTLANERTLLAYVRTALGFLVLGLALLEYLDRRSLVLPGVILILTSVIVFGTGIYRFFRVRSHLHYLRANGKF